MSDPTNDPIDQPGAPPWIEPETYYSQVKAAADMLLGSLPLDTVEYVKIDGPLAMMLGTFIQEVENMHARMFELKCEYTLPRPYYHLQRVVFGLQATLWLAGKPQGIIAIPPKAIREAVIMLIESLDRDDLREIMDNDSAASPPRVDPFDGKGQALPILGQSDPKEFPSGSSGPTSASMSSLTSAGEAGPHKETDVGTSQRTADIDRCDGCGGHAEGRVELPGGGELLFCGVHLRMYERVPQQHIYPYQG